MKLHEGSLRLAGFYLAIIMAISIFFSAIIYNLSLNELDRGLRRGVVLNRPIGPGFSVEVRDAIVQERLELYEAARNRVLGRLVITNILLLIGGGMLSYILALRTLKPIEEARDAQKRFTADASHELKTPIAAMLAENEVALMDPSLTLKQAKAQLQSNIEELYALTSLTENLLTLARSEHKTLIPEEFQVFSVMQSIVDAQKIVAESKGITVRVDVEESMTLYADIREITELLTILVDNAIKYTPPNGKVTITAKQTKQSVRIAVSDTGFGIAPKDKARIFERFYRSDSSRTKQHSTGYGLGLAIAKDIALRHDGDITVQSNLGKGSTFTVSLPNTAAKSN